MVQETKSQQNWRGDSAGPSARRSSVEPRATQAHCHFIRLEKKTNASIARTLLEHKEQRTHMETIECHAQDPTTLKHDMPESNVAVTIGSFGYQSVKSSEVRIGDCTLHMRQENSFVLCRGEPLRLESSSALTQLSRAAGVKERSVWRFQCDLVVCSSERRESAFRELGSGFGFAACAACGAFVMTTNMDASVRPPKFQRKSYFRVFVGLPG